LPVDIFLLKYEEGIRDADYQVVSYYMNRQMEDLLDRFMGTGKMSSEARRKRGRAVYEEGGGETEMVEGEWGLEEKRPLFCKNKF
jgi:hypothetical protein